MKAHRLRWPADTYLRYHDIPPVADSSNTASVPLVFVHGLGCAASCDYPRLLGESALARRRCILLDLLGAGFSDKPDHFGYSIAEHARTLEELIEALELERFDLFGHSMGGAVAIVAATRQARRIRRLLLAEPNLDAGGGTFSRAIAAYSETDYLTHGHRQTVRAATLNANPIWAGSMAVSSPLAIHRAALSLVQGQTPSWREQLLALSMPRTLFFGEHSLPNPDCETLARAGLDIRIVPQAGHSMMWDNPRALAAQICAASA